MHGLILGALLMLSEWETKNSHISNGLGYQIQIIHIYARLVNIYQTLVKLFDFVQYVRG